MYQMNQQLFFCTRKSIITQLWFVLFKIIVWTRKRGAFSYESYPLIAYSTADRGYLVKRSLIIRFLSRSASITFDDDGYSIFLWIERGKCDIRLKAALSIGMFIKKADNYSTVFLQDAISANNRYVVALFRDKWYVASNKKIDISSLQDKIKKMKNESIL